MKKNKMMRNTAALGVELYYLQQVCCPERWRSIRQV